VFAAAGEPTKKWEKQRKPIMKLLVPRQLVMCLAVAKIWKLRQIQLEVEAKEEKERLVVQKVLYSMNAFKKFSSKLSVASFRGGNANKLLSYSIKAGTYGGSHKASEKAGVAATPRGTDATENRQNETAAAVVSSPASPSALRWRAARRATHQTPIESATAPPDNSPAAKSAQRSRSGRVSFAAFPEHPEAAVTEASGNISRDTMLWKASEGRQVTPEAPHVQPHLEPRTPRSPFSSGPGFNDSRGKITLALPAVSHSGDVSRLPPHDAGSHASTSHAPFRGLLQSAASWAWGTGAPTAHTKPGPNTHRFRRTTSCAGRAKDSSDSGAHGVAARVVASSASSVARREASDEGDTMRQSWSNIWATRGINKRGMTSSTGSYVSEGALLSATRGPSTLSGHSIRTRILQ
jgi:hypothetical protein